MSAPLVPLQLSKTSSPLDGLVLVEPISPLLIKALLQTDYVLDIKTEYSKYFANSKEQLQQYNTKFNKGIQAFVITYNKPKHKRGRVYPNKNLGLTSFKRQIRNTLLDNKWYDFDIVNAQPSILLNVCKRNNIRCPTIEEYCNDRENILEQVSHHYAVTLKQAKELFIRLCFGGSFIGWTAENNINAQPTQFIQWFETELNSIALQIKSKNEDLYETARKLKNDNNETKDKKILASFFALWSQEYETNIVGTILQHLIKNTNTLEWRGDYKAGAYEFDGIKLLRQNVDKFEGGVTAFTDYLNKITPELTGFNIEWKLKSTDDIYDISDLVSRVTDDNQPDEELLKVKNEIFSYEGDLGIVECVDKVLPNYFIYSVNKNDGSKGDWYCWNGTRWERSCSPLRMAIMYDVPKYILNLMKPLNDKYDNLTTDEKNINDNFEIYERLQKKVSEMLGRLRKANDVSNAVSIARDKFRNFDLEFDTNRNLFGCENGVIDLEEGVFRPYRFTDKVSMSCGFDFKPLTTKIKHQKTTKGELEEVKLDDFTPADESAFKNIFNVIDKVFPDTKTRDYWLKIVCTGISGMAIEQFFIFNGNGRNGKGFTNEFLAVVLGDYFATSDSTIITENKKLKTSGTASPALALLDKKRYVVIKEPPKDIPIQNSSLKEITGGGVICARALYSNNNKTVLHLTICCECNVKPLFAEAPTQADARRIVDLPFNSTFVDDESMVDNSKHMYLLDPTLKSQQWRDDHKNVMLNILVHNFMELKETNYNLNSFRPQYILDRSNEYLQQSYDIHTIFLELFEERDETKSQLYQNFKGDSNGKGDVDWSLDKIQQAIRGSESMRSLPKHKQKEYTKKHIEEFFLTNKWYSKYIKLGTDKHPTVMKGWRRQIELVEEEGE